VVGAAYDAEWTKLYYGWSSDNVAAFGYRNDINDIKNNSWGPSDNGNIHTMTSAEYTALENSATTGRQGLGTIYGWAAGNGGLNDRVEYDPYASSRYTLAIGAIGDQDTRSSYNEHGSSMTVVAQSSGNVRGITTTNSSSYTSSFGGTSSASPLGCGVVALMLDANPALGWRDVTAILMESARKNHPSDGDWTVNAAGHDVSIDYGFGAIDATAAVAMASGWTNFTAEQQDSSGTQSVNQTIPDNNATGLTRTWSSSQDIEIEAVEVVININHTYIGDIEITLTSPSGTSSLLTKRRSDSQNNLNDYILTTLRCWEESSLGTWTVHVADRDAGTTGTWVDFEVKAYGHAPGAPSSMSLSSGTAIAGQTLTVDLTGATPSSSAWLAYSLTGPGSTFVSQLGVTLGLAQPAQAGNSVQTDAAGAASWSLALPAGFGGNAYWLQALQSGGVSSILSGVVQ
jgi:subtilisin-like proprotein convertase family protein